MKIGRANLVAVCDFDGNEVYQLITYLTINVLSFPKREVPPFSPLLMGLLERERGREGGILKVQNKLQWVMDKEYERLIQCWEWKRKWMLQAKGLPNIWKVNLDHYGMHMLTRIGHLQLSARCDPKTGKINTYPRESQIRKWLNAFAYSEVGFLLGWY